jgi:hypothetical protein
MLAAVLLKLGGKCVRCGFSDARALQIDHVNGGGAKEDRGRNGGSRGLILYYRVLRDTGGTFQLLCANCNWIKRSESRQEAGGAHTHSAPRKMRRAAKQKGYKLSPRVEY